MAYLESGEKVIIGIITTVLIIGGIVFLRSQINYGSPFAIFNNSQKTEINEPYIETIIEDAVQTSSAVTSQNVNLRPAPGTNNDQIKLIPQGARVWVLFIEDGWAKVIDESGAEGYITNSYLIH